MIITGGMLREARETCGISLSEMARRTYLNKGYLSRVETRHTAVPDHIVKWYEQVLGVDMNRRGLIAGLTAGAVLPGLVADAIRRGIDQESANRNHDDWMERVDTYETDAMTVGTAEMQTRNASDLILLQGQLKDARMWGVAARLMVLHGAPIGSIADSTATEQWHRSTIAAADRSEDTAIRVWVRGRSALNMAHPSLAVSACRRLATEAVRLSDKPSVGKLTALVALANAEALSGNQGASRARLNEARRVFEIVGSTDARASEQAMPEWRMNVDESLVLSRLSDPDAELAYGRAAVALPATFTRFATHLDLHRSLALVKAGDRVNGVARARAALDKLPPHKHSVALRRLFTEVAA